MHANFARDGHAYASRKILFRVFQRASLCANTIFQTFYFSNKFRFIFLETRKQMAQKLIIKNAQMNS